MYECFACVYVCAPCAGQRSGEDLRFPDSGTGVTESPVWVLGIEHRSSATIINVFNSGTVLPVPRVNLSLKINQM